MAAGGAGVVPLTIGTLSLFAAAYSGCWDTTAAPTVPVGAVGSQGNCIEVDGCGTPYVFYADVGWSCAENCAPVYSMWQASFVRDNPDVPGTSFFTVTYTNCLTGESGSQLTAYQKGATFELRPHDGATCIRTAPTGQPQYDPFQYTDPDTGCDLTVEFKGWSVLPGDQAAPVYKISPAPSARATGGVITTCNFDPVIYMPAPGGGGGGDGPVAGPWDPSWDDWDPDGGNEPPWADFLGGLLGGMLGDLVTDAIQSAFQAPVPQYQYTMRAACNYKQDGTYEDYTITLPEQPWETRVLAMQEMNIDFLQQHLLWKTPTCSGGGVGIAGDPVTVNFISDEYSPDGNDRIKKRFVYFDQTGAPLEDHVTHWKDFTWEAGAACVNLEGTPMGKCQVWASTVDEGKRVITHAAAIAGIDVADGEWIVTSSRSSRYGKPGTMRVARFTNGNYTVTKRSGPSGNPEACR